MFLRLPGFSSKEVKYFVALKSMTLKKRKILLLPSVAVPYMATLSRVHISPLATVGWRKLASQFSSPKSSKSRRQFSQAHIL